jgi:hypothetical protein
VTAIIGSIAVLSLQSIVVGASVCWRIRHDKLATKKPFTSVAPGPVDQDPSPRTYRLHAAIHVDKATQVQVIHASPFHDAPSRRIQQPTNGLDNVTHDILPFLDWV